MDVRALLAVFLVFITTAKAGEGNIEFWRGDVILTCPKEGTWKYNNQEMNQTEPSKLQIKYDGNNGVYTCTYNDGEEESSSSKTYYFYMKGKVCENCFELDPKLFGVVLVGDIIGTAFIMMVIYKCTKRKGSAESKSPNKTPSRTGGPAPPTPSRDYETLNAHTRSQDTYSIVNRTG
ncbi:hypothetical protein Q5P01_009940 [Channa striata]|uniref:CD3 gamma/delta subunit Ig-like domain-containing protein n=1 Tax=Channa striata TaxID=64152 RepID=A0AA88SV63_CHASR|nr:hypothetical protein Q5P01_009940 [Channa striata]